MVVVLVALRGGWRSGESARGAAEAAVCTALAHRRTAAICSGRIWDRGGSRLLLLLPLPAARMHASLHTDLLH